MIKTSVLEKANYELAWVVKIIESSKTKDHLQIGLNCFFLWEAKFQSKYYNISNLSTYDYLKNKFWSVYKKKEQNFRSGISKR